MKRRLLVTGCGGFVAGSILKQAGNEWELFGVSRSAVPHGASDLTHFQFDLCDSARLREAFSDIRPAAVIHTAAKADIDRSQANQAETEIVNVGVTQQLITLCREHGTKMVFCSTDAVFDGKRGNYAEEDPPHAVNFYADTKIRCEQLVQKELNDAVIARLALVAGLPMLGAGNSFLAKMIASFELNKPVMAPANEIRTPIDVVTLGQALLELAGNDFAGIIHLAGNTPLNRYDMSCQIATTLGFPTSLVIRTNSADDKARAPRPADATMNNARARRVLKTPMLDFADGLRLTLGTKEK